MPQIAHCTTAQTFKWKLINTKKNKHFYKKKIIHSKLNFVKKSFKILSLTKRHLYTYGKNPDV